MKQIMEMEFGPIVESGFDDICDECGRAIQVGDLIRTRNGIWIHAIYTRGCRVRRAE